MIEIGDQIAGFVVDKYIDRGNFGEVWKVKRQTGLSVMSFAMKLFQLHDAKAMNFAKIKKEIAVSQKISGLPHIISVIEADKYFDRFVYIISEFAEGGSLRTWLSKNSGKPRDIETALKIASEILIGLENMHREKIIHRDLKPENILKKRGFFCLADFGISREIKTHSRVSHKIGTPNYMPPEAFESKPSVSVQTDIWAVGVILQELLTGKLPFPQEEPEPLYRAILQDDPEPMPEIIPEYLRKIVTKALRKRREDRFASAADMRRALNNPDAEVIQRSKDKQKRTIIDPDFEPPDEAEKFSKPNDKAPIEIISLTNSTGIEFVKIQPGNFLMGSVDESPVHQVTISYRFQIGKYPITQEQWKIVMGKLPVKCDDGSLTGETLGDNKPVVCVNWSDAQDFADQLNLKKDGFFYRLPTEAEWEYTCRAGSTGNCAGDLNSMAWYSDNSEAGLHPVGKKQANAWGLYDMHGNVWEWVQDWHWNYKREAVTDPTGPSSGLTKVYRGGSWANPPEYCFSACRGNYLPMSCDIYLGFRLVRINV